MNDTDTSDILSNTYLFYNSFVLSFVGGILLLTGVKIYLARTCGECTSRRRMDGKTVIVTGANKGIGKETALDLAARGARVIMACRNLVKANAARDEIIRRTGNPDVVIYQLDLASLASVYHFADVVTASESRLDVLVNSAGVAAMNNELTADNLQLEVQTNYIGPFLLTNLLVALLRRSAPSRVVFVSSLLHVHGIRDLRWLDFRPEKGETASANYLRYSFTKLANIYNACELAERLLGSGVTVNSLHPGAVSTDIFGHFTGVWNLLVWGGRLFWKTSAEGAQTSIYLAVSEEVDGVTGKYFSDCKETRPCRSARDKEFGKKLWTRTEQLLETTRV